MRNKGVLTWVLIVGAVLVLLNVPTPVSRSLKSMVRESIAPLQHVLSGFTARVKESASSFRGMGGMLQDNREMAEELVHLRSKLRTLEAVENENIRLRSQLHFAQRSVRALVPCQVIGRDVSGWWNTVRLGCGAVDGVMNNNAVITSEGLVGKTIDVSRRVCDVLLISDSSCKVSVQIPRTGSFGVLEGRGDAFGDKAQCTMTFINKNVEIRPGDEVVTSGMAAAA